ncbi:hypothetical protein MMC30_002637 [Trapelia coarctata]|nr:hypothetical protein [Trapelia coarctata]
MSRFPPIPLVDLTPEQKQAHDEIDSGLVKMLGSSFTQKDSRGALIGPFAPILYTPSVASAFVALPRAVHALTGPVSPLSCELAILATGSVHGARYELYAHSRIASTLKLSPSQIAAACSGVAPEGLSEDEALAYEFGLKLAGSKGPLEAGIWERAVGRWGREGVAVLMQRVATYTYVCVVLNAGDVPVPEGEEMLPGKAVGME